MVKLVRGAQGVEGAVVDFAGKPTRVRARRGVVLATGGCAASPRWHAELAPNAGIAHTLHSKATRETASTRQSRSVARSSAIMRRRSSGCPHR
jgi:hypothetical protein